MAKKPGRYITSFLRYQEIMNAKKLYNRNCPTGYKTNIQTFLYNIRMEKTQVRTRIIKAINYEV